MTDGIRRITIATAALGGLATVLIATLPFVSFAYRSNATHVAIEVAAGLAALAVAYLIFWRFARSGTLSDLVLLAALEVTAVASLAFSALPAITEASGDFATWAPAFGRLLGAALLAAAPWCPQRPVAHRRVAALRTLVGGLAALAAISIGVTVFSDALPRAIDPALAPQDGFPRFADAPVVVALGIVHALLYVAAAAGFIRRARLTGDELMGWLGIASIVGFFARVNYVLFPSLYSDWVYTGDFFRIAFFAVLVVGAAREVRAYHDAAVAAAALEERRRIARDLHDGLAQELTFIAGETRSLASYPDDTGRVPHIATAAERALDEARDAISALNRPVDEPLDVILSRAARQVAERVGAIVELDLAEGIRATPQEREALVRIVREAVSNATRHGGARAVRVSLTRDDATRVVVSDDGCGFDVRTAQAEANGFGLAGMADRARRLGGRVEIESAPGAGTRVEVAIP